MLNKVKEFINKDEVKEIAQKAQDNAKSVLSSPAGKEIAAGAAAGAVVASIIPLVGTVAGAQVGAALGAYKYFTKGQ